MKALKSNPHFYSFLWDFSADGGAIGNYNTRIQPPAQTMIISAFVDVITPGISLGAQIDFTFNLSNPGGLGGIPAPIVSLDRATYNFMNTNASPYYALCTGEEIIMSIGLFPFTAGKVKFHFICIEAKV